MTLSLLVILILLSAFLSASETSLFSLSSLTLKSYKSSRDKRQRLVASLMERSREVLVTILMLNVLANLLVQNTVSNLFDKFPDWTLKVGVPLVLTLVFGEIIPKSLALPNNVAVARFAAPYIDWMARILKPVRNPLTRATHWISRFLFAFLRKEPPLSPDELRHVLKSSEEKGALPEQEASLIEGSLDLHDSSVKERMRPREEILYYDIQDPLDKLTHLFVDLETTRVPICDGDLEKLLGVLSARRFFFQKEKIQKSSDLLAIIKKPYFVPETTKAWTLLKNLRDRAESLAIVVDEYGSISGLITQEDLIEAVVGEIHDRRDVQALYTRSSDDVIIASARLELQEFEDIFGVSLRSESGAKTLGGWLIEQLGDIPIPGVKYANDQFLFYILAAEPHRILKVYVRRVHPSSQGGVNHAY